MDFQSESWDISEETDSLNKSLFSRSFIPTNSVRNEFHLAIVMFEMPIIDAVT